MQNNDVAQQLNSCESILSEVEGGEHGGTSLAKLAIERILRRGTAPNAQDALCSGYGVAHLWKH